MNHVRKVVDRLMEIKQQKQVLDREEQDLLHQLEDGTATPPINKVVEKEKKKKKGKYTKRNKAFWNRKKRSSGVVASAERILAGAGAKTDGRKTRWKKARMSEAQKKVWLKYTPEEKQARLNISLKVGREKKQGIAKEVVAAV